MKTLKLTFAGLLLAAAISPAAEDPSPDHVKWMKALGAQTGAIRKGADVTKNAAALEDTMKQVTVFWAARHSEAADKANKSINAGAAALTKAGEDKDAQMAAIKMIGGGCKGCHDAHREKISDTEYKIK
ncbi:MAG: cytochrome c [Acidobacteria bacterium]|nr:cytochrome c [Acidobacteriota bacterium]